LDRGSYQANEKAKTAARLADQGKDVLPLSTSTGRRMELTARGNVVLDEKSVFRELALKTLSLGADTVDVDYKYPFEEVCAMKSGIGFGIESIRGSSDRAKSLREELHRLAKKKKGRITLGETEYEFRARVYDSFGNDAFQVELHQLGKKRSQLPDRG
jgi:hypothetical protein